MYSVIPINYGQASDLPATWFAMERRLVVFVTRPLYPLVYKGHQVSLDANILCQASLVAGLGAASWRDYHSYILLHCGTRAGCSGHLCSVLAFNDGLIMATDRNL